MLVTKLESFLQAPRRVLMIAPHPDDESLGTGGMIQRVIRVGGEVHVVFITDGDNNPWPQRYLEHRWRIGPGDRARWAERRREEGRRALETLAEGKVTHESLGLPDATILDLHAAGSHGPRPAITHLLRERRPDLLLLPSPIDRHRDHRGTYQYAVEAMRLAGFAGRAYTYLIHRPWRQKLLGAAPGSDSLALSPEEQATKLRAIECHRTQMALSRARFSRFASPREHYNVVGPNP